MNGVLLTIEEAPELKLPWLCPCGRTVDAAAPPHPAAKVAPFCRRCSRRCRLRAGLAVATSLLITLLATLALLHNRLHMISLEIYVAAATTTAILACVPAILLCRNRLPLELHRLTTDRRGGVTLKCWIQNEAYARVVAELNRPWVRALE